MKCNWVEIAESLQHWFGGSLLAIILRSSNNFGPFLEFSGLFWILKTCQFTIRMTNLDLRQQGNYGIVLWAEDQQRSLQKTQQKGGRVQTGFTQWTKFSG